MEIWIEYFKRHGIPIVRPYEPFQNNFTPHIYVREAPLLEHRVWSQFIVNNRELITNNNPSLESLIQEWHLLHARTPPVREQLSILFSSVPGLERMWNSYSLNTNRVPVIRNAIYRDSRYP